MLNIRPLHIEELPRLKDFAPPDWKTDLSATFAFHYGQPYFYPLAAELDGELVGCANGLWNGNSGWLGNIIVLPEFRGHGIGHELTRHLVDLFHAKGCTSQILIATEMGEPIYRQIGFKTVSNYIFLKSDQPVTPVDVTTIRQTRMEDAEAICRMDRSITGEDRRPFLERFFTSGWVHESAPGVMDGFYLPDLAQGPVLAETVPAGQALLSLKVSLGSRGVVVPETNKSALSHLIELGFREYSRAPRMVLGRDADWHPEYIYSRGGGYCG